MAAQEQTKSLRVLIIDDELIWQEEIAEVVEDLGYRPQMLGKWRVDLADQVESVLSDAEKEGDPFSIVTIDWVFEIETGKEHHLGRSVLRRLKKRYPYIACILISGNSDAAQKLLGLRDDYNLGAYISKMDLDEKTVADAVNKGMQHIKLLMQPDKSKPVSPHYITTLHQNLNAHFSLDELMTLCFYIQIEFDNLGSPTKEGKIRELIKQAQRKGMFQGLLTQCQEMRPHVSWDIDG